MNFYQGLLKDIVMTPAMSPNLERASADVIKIGDLEEAHYSWSLCG